MPDKRLPELLSVKQAAQVLGQPEHAIRAMVAGGTLTNRSGTTRVLIARRELELMGHPRAFDMEELHQVVQAAVTQAVRAELRQMFGRLAR